MTHIWRVWKYALGSFSDRRTSRYDNHVAVVRTVIFISYMITNTFIVSGVIRHWNGVNSNVVKSTQLTEVPNVQGTTSKCQVR